MSLPGVFGWFVLAVVMLLFTVLSKVRHGWPMIAGVAVLLAALTFGFQWGHGEGVRDAAAVVDTLDRDACNIAYPRDAKPFFDALGRCNREIARVRLESGRPSMPFWAAIVPVLVGLAALIYLMAWVESTLLAQRQGGVVVRPNADQQEGKKRPRQRRAQKTGGAKDS